MTMKFLGESPEALAAKATSLAQDLAELIRTGQPSPEALATAPMLDLWLHTKRTTSALAGRVDEHPLLGHRRLIRTSDVFAIDPEMGWARTWSRFYRLGRNAAAFRETIQ